MLFIYFFVRLPLWLMHIQIKHEGIKWKLSRIYSYCFRSLFAVCFVCVYSLFHSLCMWVKPEWSTMCPGKWLVQLVQFFHFFLCFIYLFIYFIYSFFCCFVFMLIAQLYTAFKCLLFIEFVVAGVEKRPAHTVVIYPFLTKTHKHFKQFLIWHLNRCCCWPHRRAGKKQSVKLARRKMKLTKGAVGGSWRKTWSL